MSYHTTSIYVVHVIYILYTFYIISIQISYIFIDVLVMFRTCSGQVLGVENKFFPKSVGGLWAILWHHRRCLRRGGKILKICFFLKNKVGPKRCRIIVRTHGANQKIHIFFLESIYALFHFSLFIFSYVSLLSPFWGP